MNLTLAQGEELMNEIVQANINMEKNQEAIFAVPFPYLITNKSITDKAKNFITAAQNCASENSGAYTGEVSCQMLQSINIKYVLIGHSERREYYNETNQVLVKNKPSITK